MMHHKSARLCSSWAMTLLLVAVVASYIWRFTPLFKDPPVRIISISATVDGADLIVDVHMVKDRACDTDAARLLIDERGIVRQPWMSGNAQLPVGEHWRQQRFPLPADVKPGERYAFRSVTVYGCIDGRWLVESPDAFFVVP